MESFLKTSLKPSKMRRLVSLILALSLQLALPFQDASAACVGYLSFQSGGDGWPHKVPYAVKLALDGGDHSVISPCLANTVELQLPDCSGIFSKKQAEMILSKFMADHSSMTYSVSREESVSGATLTIGKLSGSAASFGVYVLSQPAAGSQQIKQLRIEEQK